MPTSQNGYIANDPSLTVSIAIPGGKLRVRKDPVATVFQYLTIQFHNRVEKLVWPGCWGYAERPIRGSETTLSNHASGTAIDLNAPEHPLGKRNTFTAAQVEEIRSILAECSGVVRWGGDYKNRADEMHFEIDADVAVVTAAAYRIEQFQKEQEGKPMSAGEAKSINDNIDRFEQVEANRYARYEAIHKEEMTAIAKLTDAVNRLPQAIADAIKAAK